MSKELEEQLAKVKKDLEAANANAATATAAAAAATKKAEAAETQAASFAERARTERKAGFVSFAEAQVKAGFSISLTELAAASHREQKKPSVLEKLREKTPEQAKNKTAPKRSAEREL